MIIWSPFILDELAGLRDSAPPTITDDPTSGGIGIQNRHCYNIWRTIKSKWAAWADIRYFSVINDGNTDVASEFVKFSMSEAYTATLSIAPEGKFPVRRGDASNPTKYVEAWSKTSCGCRQKSTTFRTLCTSNDK